MDSGGERFGSLTSGSGCNRSQPRPPPSARPGSGPSRDDEGCRAGGREMAEGQGSPQGGPEPSNGRLPERSDASAQPAQAPSPPGTPSPENLMPIMDWEALENHIAGLQLQEMEKQSRESCCSPAVAIRESPLGRRKMDGAQRLTSWERTENNSWPTMGATFSCTSRFHSRMNLQLCFINDSSSESESDDLAQGVSATPSPQEAPDEVPSAEGDLHSRQKELECEAKRGLAMVKRQIDLEKQKQRTQAASDWSGEAQWRGRGLEPSVLHEMTLVQLQSLQANVFSQIHRLNTQLMELLESRDDLQTEQDAMLVEIGDLTH